jgi:glycosyltransferase involved in cell wall biosynthesis
MASGSPLVSCICVTHHHVEVLKRAILCFQHQTYPNKELILGITSANIAAISLLEQLNDPRIKTAIFPSSSRFTLGQKRNWVIENSEGFYFCVWDDDDWYNDTRIEFQVHSLEGTTCKSSVLSSLILFDSENNIAYLSATRWAWEQTLLCERSVLEVPALRYADLERGEDSVLIYNLKKNDLLLTVINPSLYIYVYHGQNTWHRKHWDDNLIRWATQLTEDQSDSIKKILLSESPDNTILKSLRLEIM